MLRAVNVGGRAKIAMAALRRLLADLGIDNVTSLLHSGNVGREAGAGTSAELARRSGENMTLVP